VRIAKWVAIVLGGLLALALLTVLTVTVFVDPNRFRGQIERAVTRASGQPFDIEGDLEISWFPWLALRTGPSQFGATSVSPGQPAAQPIVRWESARVGARLVPLLKGQLVIDTVRLDGPRVHLVRHADGTSNWDEMLTSFKNRPKEPEQPESPDQPPGPQISGLQIRKGILSYVDERADSTRSVSLTNWDLDVGEWRAGSTFPVETQFSLDAGSGIQAEGTRLSTRLHFSDDANDIDLFGLQFSSRIHGGTLPKTGLPVEFEVSRMAVRLTPLDIAISELSSRVATARLTTSIQAGETGPDRTFYVRGPIDLQLPSVRDFLKLVGLEPALPLDKSTLGPLKLTSMLAWENGAIAANAVDLTLDETHLTGEVARTAGEKPVWTFGLHGDKIALDRYLSLEDKSNEPFELPVKALKALQVQGELTFEQATVGKTQMRGVKLRVELEDGKVRTASK
jgi:AsmA protein